MVISESKTLIKQLHWRLDCASDFWTLWNDFCRILKRAKVIKVCKYRKNSKKINTNRFHGLTTYWLYQCTYFLMVCKYWYNEIAQSVKDSRSDIVFARRAGINAHSQSRMYVVKHFAVCGVRGHGHCRPVTRPCSIIRSLMHGSLDAGRRHLFTVCPVKCNPIFLWICLSISSTLTIICIQMLHTPDQTKRSFRHE